MEVPDIVMNLSVDEAGLNIVEVIPAPVMVILFLLLMFIFFSVYVPAATIIAIVLEPQDLFIAF